MTITIEKNESLHGVCTVTLNRPEYHNAFDEHLIADLTDAFKRLSSDDCVRVVILAGAGKNFSAGADLNWMQRCANYTVPQNLGDARRLVELLQAIKQCSKPTIARVQGATFGGGVGLVACCDIAVATTTASFCLSEVKLGMVPAVISPHLVAAMGARATQKLTLTAERFNAQTALQLGLIHHLAEDEQALGTQINTLCKQLLNGAPKAQSEAKLLFAMLHNKKVDEEMIEDTAQLIARLRASEEGQEGIAAFLQKRSPGWHTDN